MNETKVAPSLLNVITPHSKIYVDGTLHSTHPDIVDNSLAPLSRLALEAEIPWALNALSAVNLYAEDQRQRDKANSKLVKALTQHAMELNHVSGTNIEKIYGQIYNQVDVRVRKEKITADPEFAQAVYTDIIPTLLGINGVSGKFANEAGYNSSDQVVETALAIMRAPQAKDQGGKLRIFSQMCAQYSSGDTHSQDSFNQGLLDTLDSSKVDQVMSPVKKITEVLNRFNIPVEVITPQVTAEPRLMLAMVPATVWGYVDQGKVAEMLARLDEHAQTLPELFKSSLGITEPDSKCTLIAPSYSDTYATSTSVTEDALGLSELFSQLYFLEDNKNNLRERDWTQVTHSELHSFIRDINRSNYFLDDLVHKAKDKGYNEDQIKTFRLMLRTISHEGWGTLDDTIKFYRREIQRRADSKMEDWKRKTDSKAEVDKLIHNEGFYPYLSEDERDQKAQELVKWTDVIANIGIGARAIFNTALYASLGHHLAQLNSGPNVAIMIPFEEDVDRWGLDIMNCMWQESSGKKDSIIPCLYPDKTRRQPFSN